MKLFCSLNGIRDMCNDLRLPADQPLQAFVRWVNYVYGNLECRDLSYAHLIEQAGNISFNQPGTISGS